MVKIVKNPLRNFLVICLIFLTTLGWFFSGWPQILQEPPVPPKIQETKAAPESLILFWDGGVAAPAGWDCISCDVVDTYYQKFPRATSTPGGIGGTTTHTHTVTFASSTSPGGIEYDTTGAVSYPASDHIHSSISDTTMNATNAVPAYYELKMIASTSPSTLPAGTIAMFSTTSLPENWNFYTDADGLIIRGGPNASTSNTSNHTHDGVAFSVATSSSCLTTALGGKGSQGEYCDHAHTVSGGIISAGDTLPPYIDVVLAKASISVPIPTGLIAMFDTTPLPSNWTEVLAINSNRFIRASSTGYGGTGGSATHGHPNHPFTTGVSNNQYNDADSAPNEDGATYNHTHDITVSFSSGANNIPPYRDTVFAEYTGAANQPPTVSNVSLNASSTIVLSSNSTTSVSATTSVSDPEGCATISTTTAVIYREGATSGCGADNNNCYIVGSCIQDACEGTNATYTCTIAMEFFADPTDEGTYAQSQGWNSEEWIALITVYDNQDSSATGSNETVEEIDVQTLLAFDLSTTTIDYGKVNPNETSTEQTVTVSTIGNAPLDVNASGTEMTWSGNNIGASWQHWSTTTGFIWDDGTALGATPTLIELESGKPTQSPSNATDDIYWKLKVPLDKKGGGPYEGTNVFIEIQD